MISECSSVCSCRHGSTLKRQRIAPDSLDRRKKARPSTLDLETEVELQLRTLDLDDDDDDDSNWAHLGADLLEYIQTKLPLPDILRCRSVCRSWRAVTNRCLENSPAPPPLLIWEKGGLPDYPRNVQCWFFHAPLRTKRPNLYLPNTKSRQLLLGGGEMGRCVGSSSDGRYFLHLDRLEDKTFFLFHPASGSRVRFPPISISIPGDDDFIRKAVLWGADPVSASSDITSACGLVLLMRSPDQAAPLFAKFGSPRFTQLECRHQTKITHVICVNNRIYGITGDHPHYFNAWDSTDDDDDVIPSLVLEFKPTFSTPFPTSSRILRLVESKGDILLVSIDFPNQRMLQKHGGTIKKYSKVFPMCQVFKMDFHNKAWVKINSLGDLVLFVTEFQSMCFSSLDFPQYQRNSVYYQHRQPFKTPNGEPSLAVFNITDRSVKVFKAKRPTSGLTAPPFGF